MTYDKIKGVNECKPVSERKKKAIKKLYVKLRLDLMGDISKINGCLLSRVAQLQYNLNVLCHSALYVLNKVKLKTKIKNGF